MAVLFAKANIPSSGTYKFTSSSGIKNEPKLASADLAYYDTGMTVNYDSVVTSEGKQWISYVSYAGNRRYIAIVDAGATVTPAKTNKYNNKTCYNN